MAIPKLFLYSIQLGNTVYAAAWRKSARAQIPNIITSYISTIFSSFDTFDTSDTSNPIAVKILEENMSNKIYFKKYKKSGKYLSDVSNVRIPAWRALWALYFSAPSFL